MVPQQLTGQKAPVKTQEREDPFLRTEKRLVQRLASEIVFHCHPGQVVTWRSEMARFEQQGLLVHHLYPARELMDQVAVKALVNGIVRPF